MSKERLDAMRVNIHNQWSRIEKIDNKGGEENAV